MARGPVESPSFPSGFYPRKMNQMNQITNTSGMTSSIDQHRPFPCDECSKLFTRSENLQRHKRAPTYINDMVIVAVRQDLQFGYLSHRCHGRVCMPLRQWSA
ncbi:uncharacterized protein N7479_007505 [Penicillium vulpinum]|uniref:uncharacterized protein n=1 Tax=Penicillium vulpinum TaxID=29845 RepID=UPI002548DD51|nr:uncharacterized protein N7479_007505 [Penicillium vulpinum]KAJ5960355.1 hypothetical protein N7479_007505 [Penicillium vulpinum]